MVDEPIFEAKMNRNAGGHSALTMIVVAVAVLGLALWFWHRTTTVQAIDSDSSTSEVKSLLHLDSFVINLISVSGNGYLRVGIDLGLGTDLKESDAKLAFVARVRDTILAVLATRSVEELLTPEGKAKLKDDLLKAIRERIPEIHCHEVYFTEFLVQH